jgi:hypothetical protein
MRLEQYIISRVGGCYLDKNNILWKYINGEYYGKRSVWTFDLRACWIEDTTHENIKSWWCGKDADYSEVFRPEPISDI